MAFYTMIGFLVIAGVISLGVLWVMDNISFKRQPERYTYKTDKAGNEYVQDNSEKDEPDAKT